MTIKGIDVSAYQSNEYPTGGMHFVFIKATEGRSYVNPKQSRQARHGRSAGLVTGFYHFLWPGNIKAQAAYFVNKCVERPGEMLACDWERTTSGTAATSAEKDAFLREVKRLRPRHKVLLYCNRDFWLNRDTSSYAGDGLWIAQYNGRPGRPDIKAPWRFHQYTSTPIDTNIGKFSSRAALRAWAAEEFDMPLTKDDIKKVWTTDGFIKAPTSNADNPYWQPASYLRDTNVRLREVQKKLAAQSAAITELAKAMAAQEQIRDADELVERIRTAIDEATADA